MEQDDEAAEEVDRWILENNEFAARGAGLPGSEMRQRIRKRFEPVRAGYMDLIRRHPDNAEVRLAFASFLGDMGEIEAEGEQLEKAAELDPKNPATWNNLGNHYGHFGPTEKAFRSYEKAVALKPDEPLYHFNLATTVFLFRPAAREYYGITDEQVFDKALGLYDRTMQLDPSNFKLASEIASNYYVINFNLKPPRIDEALRAWTNAFKLAPSEVDRQDVQIHFARFKINGGRFEEAREHLALVTDPTHAVMKERVERMLNQKEAQAAETNAPAPAAQSP
jgi:tetratricopeptide (TPR) repeat protein